MCVDGGCGTFTDANDNPLPDQEAARKAHEEAHGEEEESGPDEWHNYLDDLNARLIAVFGKDFGMAVMPAVELNKHVDALYEATAQGVKDKTHDVMRSIRKDGKSIMGVMDIFLKSAEVLSDLGEARREDFTTLTVVRALALRQLLDSQGVSQDLRQENKLLLTELLAARVDWPKIIQHPKFARGYERDWEEGKGLYTLLTTGDYLTINAAAREARLAKAAEEAQESS